MATGDLKNNIKQLQSELKAVKYSQVLDIDGLIKGSPPPYLAIYHYIFTTYNTELNHDICNSNNELYGKSDMRFMEAVYKILRDMFDYKPHINREQFFSPGFAERKVIMATDVLRLVRKRYSLPKTSSFKVAVTRDDGIISPREKVQVEPVERHRKIASKSSPDVMGAAGSLKHVTPSAGSSSLSNTKTQNLKTQPLEAAAAARTPDVALICHDRHSRNQDEEFDGEQPPVQPRVERHTPNNQDSSHSIMLKCLDTYSNKLSQIQSWTEKFETRIMNLENTKQTERVQQYSPSPAQISVLTKQMNDVVFKLETLTARVVLIENRLMMVEAKLSEDNKKEKSPDVLTQTVHSDQMVSSAEEQNRKSFGVLSSLGTAESVRILTEERRGIEHSSDGLNKFTPDVVTELKTAHPKMAFIKTLVSGDDRETSLTGDGPHPSVSENRKCYNPALADLRQNQVAPFVDMVSPIRPLTSRFKYADVQDDSLVSVTSATTENSVGKSDRRSSTPTHVLLDTSTMDRVSRISQMMADTEELLH